MTDPVYKTPATGRGKKRNPWPVRVTIILFIWILIYFFFAGPGRLLFPALLISYSSVSDGNNTVYYYGDRIEKALDLLWVASLTQDSIRHFAGDTVEAGFNDGITLFLCESPRQYFHLTWNHAMGSSILGRIVLNESGIEGNMSMYSAVVHEMYHRYIIRKHGYLPSVLFYPKWFEEGCATMLQEYSSAADRLGQNLLAEPYLVTSTSLEHPWNWQSMTRMEKGKMASRGYGQVCLFTRHLAERFGIEKIRTYDSRLHWNLNPDQTFGKVFGTSLAVAEAEWLESAKKSGMVPAGTTFIPLPFDILVFLRWMFVLMVLLTPVFFLIRWISRWVAVVKRSTA